MKILRRLRGRDPRLVAWRAWRAFVVRARLHLGTWARMDRALRRGWTPERTARWWDDLVQRPVLLAHDALSTARSWATVSAEWKSALRTRGEAMMAGRFTVLDEQVEVDLDSPPWSRDWRHDHQWPLGPVYAFDHYLGGRAAPWDVKRPWEFSRLMALVDLVQWGALTDDAAPVQLALSLLASWDRADPVGRSVNWAPMEASMRLLALAQVAEILARSRSVPPTEATLIPALIALHAEWIFWMAERTEVNGNHFDANLAALAVAGELLDGWSPRARVWRAFAARYAAGEILAQFSEDGVNVEGATGYHRLVAELFLVLALAGRRRGRPLPAEAEERLRKASRFLAAAQRPDGWLPAFGDNDSARVIALDGRHTRDPGEGLALAAWYFADPACAPMGGSYAVLPWFAGSDELVPTPTRDGGAFREGGIGIARRAGHHLIVDVANVGMRGRGGHGHNDILSFEWSVSGEAVLVDPGQLTYTGDRATYDRYRGSVVHSAIVVDAKEVAELLGPWRIADQARPTEFSWAKDGESVVIRGGHSGYARLEVAARVRRTWRFRLETGALELEDEIGSSGPHDVTRRFQFAPGWEVQVRGQGAVATRDRSVIDITWEGGVRGAVLAATVAPTYGIELPAPALVLTVRPDGPATWRTTFVPRPKPA